ncbi:MAG: lytic transglycosylase domain-containing protein [Firmicutes bacterium]|nr:lytic transglycosylase domain-containing protein [Bacillota bacterium]
MDTLLWMILQTLLETLETSSPSSSASSSSFTRLLEAAGTDSVSTVPASDTHAPAAVQTALMQAAQSTGLSSRLLAAVAQVESGDNPQAISSAGAIGVMQLMPGTAQQLGVNAANVTQNVLGGAEYLKSLLTQFHGNLSLAIAAYNAGPGAVEAYGGIPPYTQTEQYVQKVLSAYQAMPAAGTSLIPPSTSSY